MNNDTNVMNNCGNYAKPQNALYDPSTNQILYGISTNMSALGVGDGNCKDIVNPLLFTDKYKCGLGSADGGCPTNSKKRYGIETFISDNLTDKTVFYYDFYVIIIVLYLLYLIINHQKN